MRYPPEHKVGTRQRIVAAAARLFRRRGVRATTLPEVMREAGLTVGGFYRHFPSKAALFQEALADSLNQTLHTLERGAAQDAEPDARIEAVVARYLSQTHLADVDRGCPLPALTTDVARAEPEVKQIYAEALKTITGALTPHMPGVRGESQTREAWGMLALLVGGLALARGVDRTELAEEILDACRMAAGRLASPGGAPHPR